MRSVYTFAPSFLLFIPIIIISSYFESVSSTTTTDGNCLCECTDTERQCDARGGCFRIDLELDGENLLASSNGKNSFRACHEHAKYDHYYQDLYRRLKLSLIPDEILTIRSSQSNNSPSTSINPRLVLAVQYCKRKKVKSTCDHTHEYKLIGDNKTAENWCKWNMTHAERFAWRRVEEDGEYSLLNSDWCNEASGVDFFEKFHGCWAALRKNETEHHKTLCKWRNATRGNATSTKYKQFKIFAEAKDASHGALGVVSMVMCLSTCSAIYEIIRWKKQRRRKKPGVGFGDRERASSNKTSAKSITMSSNDPFSSLHKSDEAAMP